MIKKMTDIGLLKNKEIKLIYVGTSILVIK